VASVECSRVDRSIRVVKAMMTITQQNRRPTPQALTVQGLGVHTCRKRRSPTSLGLERRYGDKAGAQGCEAQQDQQLLEATNH
jgi:hypothetical protein